MTRPPIAVGRTDPARIRNFCIIAHIDHGKSTLADRMLQLTGVVDPRQMRAQYLDRMDIERERGITIKAQNVRMPWTSRETGVDHVLHMIDTPGHVDFTYEVSRSLAACEGAVLLVDAAQGIEAQTLANLYLALENDLHVIPVLNKIDLPAAQPDVYAAEIAHIIGCDPDDVLRVSAKTGQGVDDLLDLICREIPAPVGEADAPPRAMIFDSVYDIYRGVITYIRVVDGQFTPRERIKMMSTGAMHELLEIGVISPEPVPTERPGRRRGRLPDHRREGRPPVARRRHGHRRRQARQAGRSAATATRGRWSTPACTRSTARTTRCCATRWTGCNSTTPRWSTSPSRVRRWASGSAAASSACCTSRSPATASSASSTST